MILGAFYAAAEEFFQLIIGTLAGDLNTTFENERYNSDSLLVHLGLSGEGSWISSIFELLFQK